MPTGNEHWVRDALPRDTIVNGFRITRIIGRGGFGITYEATDRLDQRFAVKECFPREFAARNGLDVVANSRDDEDVFEDCRSRFLREGRALVQLGRVTAAGEGVVKVVFAFEAHGTGYLVMELLAGQTLEDLINDHPAGLPPARLEELMRAVLAALGCVHDAGLLHRDLKPTNIARRDDGRPVLIDFGAVREAGGGRTTMYTRFSTRGYTPIEQSSGLLQGPMSDFYAFGATFYRAIGGALEDAEQRERAVRRGLPDPMRSAAETGAGRYPDGILAAIDASLRIEPEDRPQSIAELVALLDQTKANPPPPPPQPIVPPEGRAPPAPEPPRFPSSHPVFSPAPTPMARGGRAAWAVIASAAVVLLVVALGLTIVARNPAPPAEITPSAPAPTAPAHTRKDKATVQSDRQQSATQQLERSENDRRQYQAARGSIVALSNYLNSCQVCTMKAAAQAEINQLQLGEREAQAYAAARGDPAALRSYVASCQICEMKLAAQSEIQQLERSEQERRQYQAARGSIAALKQYVDNCQICDSKTAALTEIDRLTAAAPVERSELFCGRVVNYALVPETGARSLVGVWMGQWNRGPPCSVLIVQRPPSSGAADVFYQYQLKSGTIGHFNVSGSVDSRGTLSFADPDGAEFVFRFTGSSHLDAGFRLRRGALTGTFAKIR